MGSPGVPGLYGKYDGFKYSGLIPLKYDFPVYSLVSAFLLFNRPRPNKPERPPLELIGIGFGQGRSIGKAFRFAHYFVLDFRSKGV